MAISKSSIICSSMLYKREHGSNPRGYGNWGFDCKGNNSKDEFWYLGMFTEAKRAAISFCAENEYRVCKVLP